jgi:hypothetical protein
MWLLLLPDLFPITALEVDAWPFIVGGGMSTLAELRLCIQDNHCSIRWAMRGTTDHNQLFMAI